MLLKLYTAVIVVTRPLLVIVITVNSVLRLYVDGVAKIGYGTLHSLSQ